MPVDQNDSVAIAAVLTELRQCVLDGGVPRSATTAYSPQGAIDAAALRLAALALFDMAMLQAQNQYEQVQEATTIATLEELVARECTSCLDGMPLRETTDGDDGGFVHVDENGTLHVCNASTEAVRMLLDARGQAHTFAEE